MSGGGCGVDTVVLSYPVYLCRSDHAKPGEDFVFTGKHGSLGPVRWSRWRHESGIDLTLKGVPGRSTHAIYDGSVAKALGIIGPASVSDLVLLDKWIRGVLRHDLVNAPTIRRLDATVDVPDPEGLLRRAAVGWTPHARARYVESVINDCQTVWLHNKTRGIRVYDKFAESGEEWSRDLTRVEYQIRGHALWKAGIDRVASLTDDTVAREITPLVADLQQRRDSLQRERGQSCLR